LPVAGDGGSSTSYALYRMKASVAKQSFGGSNKRADKVYAPPVAAMTIVPAVGVQREASCACGGGCPRCRNKSPIRTKLAVSKPGDIYEQEADRVAEQVLRMPAGERCSDSPGEEKGKSLQRKTEGSFTISTPAVSDSFVQNLGSGRPLDSENRAFFEPRFDRDFSNVRIHTGAKAAESARAVNALAYTAGRDVVFGAAPERRLLAHELAHVVQQAGGAHAMMQRQPDPQSPEPPPSGITIDVLDPLNSSLRLGGFGLPSPRDVLNGLDAVRRFGQPPATDLPLPPWPQPVLSDDELRAAACRALPSLCQQTPPPPQLQLPQFRAPRLIFHDNLTIDHFIFDKFTIPDRHRLALDQKATDMIDGPNIVTDLVGHSDTRGPPDYNQRLSEQRARSVSDYLLGRSVPSSQIWNVTGVGESHPKFPNDATDNLAASRNRRVEMDMRRLVWQWTLPSRFILRPPGRGNISVTDPRDRVLAAERPMFNQLRTFLVRVQGEITTALAAGPVGHHNLTADNENVQAALALFDHLIADVQSERYVVRFDQPTTSNVAASYSELEDLIHLRPFRNDQELSQVVANLLHEYAHAIQDRTAEELLRARRLPLEHTREDELRKETEARRHEVYFASLLIGVGHHFGAAGFGEEISVGVFIGRFERERTGSPAEQAAARKEIRKELESAYQQQLATNAPTRRYLIEIRSGPSAALIGLGGVETDLGSIPDTVRTTFQLDAHLAHRLEISPVFPGLFRGRGATPNSIALFVSFDGDRKVAEFGLPRPTP
jgi:outer membrane protein OmpA-like peptidoglycan-associated protein